MLTNNEYLWLEFRNSKDIVATQIENKKYTIRRLRRAYKKY